MSSLSAREIEHARLRHANWQLVDLGIALGKTIRAARSRVIPLALRHRNRAPGSSDAIKIVTLLFAQRFILEAFH
jgi:hypothetical protein